MTPGELDELEADARRVVALAPDNPGSWPARRLALIAALRAAWAERDVLRECVDADHAYRRHVGHDFSAVTARCQAAYAALRALGWRPESEGL